MKNSVRDPNTANEIARLMIESSAKIDKKFGVPPIVRGDTKKESWLNRKIAWLKFKYITLRRSRA